MLSILIPVYNFDVRVLVEELHRQALGLSLPAEILCFDDGSAEQWKTLNREVALLSSVRYKEWPENLGRSRIRNALADAARLGTLAASEVIGHIGPRPATSLKALALGNGFAI